MNPEEFTQRLNDLVEEATSNFSRASVQAQKLVMDKLEVLIKQLELNGELIKPTSANLKLIRSIDDQIRDILLESNYSKQGDQFLKTYGQLGVVQNEYFSNLSEAFVPNEAMFNRFKNNAISLTEESLSGAGLDSQFIEPIRKILNDNITSGASFPDMKKQLSEFILGNSERLGRLESYSGQITRDALNQFSANYHEQVSQDLGLDWFLYRGGTVKDTRPFCRERHGKYYHRSEVEAWPNQNWAGKIPGTTASTIYTYRGGWRCMHFIVGVDKRVVPKSDLARIPG